MSYIRAMVHGPMEGTLSACRWLRSRCRGKGVTTRICVPHATATAGSSNFVRFGLGLRLDFATNPVTISVLMPVLNLLLNFIKPPRFEGGTFANFGPGGDACQQRAKYAISMDHLYHKCITRGVCQF